MPQIAVESFEVLKSIFSCVGKATVGSSCWLNRKKIQDENLQRIAGIGTLIYLLLKKV